MSALGETALGQVALGESSATAQALSPSLYTNTNIFYAATVTGGVATIKPSLYVDDDTFFSSNVTTLSHVLPSLYVDADTFFSEVVSSRYTLFPSLYVDPDSFYNQAVTSKNNLTPALYNDPDIFYSPSVSGGISTLYPSLYIDPDIFYSHNVNIPGAFVPPPTIFSGVVGPPPVIPGQRVDVLIDGVVLFCTATLIPGWPETISFFPGIVNADANITIKESRPALLHLIPGEAKCTVGLSKDEVEALMLILLMDEAA